MRRLKETKKTKKPKPLKTKSKNSKRKTSKSNDSFTNVNFSDYIKNEWKGENRVVKGIRVNSELYNEFKQVSKQLYGSTCRAVESYMASLVLSARQKVNFSSTQQPININKIVIERNLRPRRKLEITGQELIDEKVKQARREEQKLINEKLVLNERFGRVAEQWNLHPSKKWREIWLVHAKGYPELSNAQRVLELNQKELELA